MRQPPHYAATLSLAEGRCTGRITDFVLEIGGAPTPTYAPAETTLLQTPPTKAATDFYYVRTAFEEATAQLLGTLGLR